MGAQIFLIKLDYLVFPGVVINVIDY